MLYLCFQNDNISLMSVNYFISKSGENMYDILVTIFLFSVVGFFISLTAAGIIAKNRYYKRDRDEPTELSERDFYRKLIGLLAVPSGIMAILLTWVVVIGTAPRTACIVFVLSLILIAFYIHLNAQR